MRGDRASAPCVVPVRVVMRELLVTAIATVLVVVVVVVVVRLWLQRSVIRLLDWNPTLAVFLVPWLFSSFLSALSRKKSAVRS